MSVLLLSLGVIMIFGCRKPNPPPETGPADVVLHVPGMY
jgi:hypothetical protein